MVAPSKLFTRPLNCYHCSQLILHPGIGCFRSFLISLLTHGVSSLKYFSPLLITPLVLKYQSMNRELLIRIVKHYLLTVFGASLSTAATFFFMCCLRNILGDFRTYTTLFLPTVVGMQFCRFFPANVMKLFTTATSQAVLEGLLLQYSNKFTHLILYSPMVQTILFMLNSAIILHYKRKNIYKGFWFVQPHGKLIVTTNKRDQEETNDDKYYKKYEKTKCDHTNISCRKFALDGMKSYILYGIPLDLLTLIMKGTSKLNGKNGKIVELFKKFRPNMTCFLISYICIYRLSSCLLRKCYNHLTLEVQHLLSAFLSGFSYMFVQRINFLTLSVVLTIQLLWQQICINITRKRTKSNGKSNLVLMMLGNMPISEIILSINSGYLVHNYIFNYRLVNPLARGFLNGITHNKPKNIRNIIINNDMQSLIKLGNTNIVKTFL